MRQLTRQLFKFSTQESVVKQQQSGSITTAEHKFAQTPIHLKPYDKTKYEVVSPKIKKNSGYALLQIEPFPRARIIKICYKILENIKVGIPQTFPDRIFIEQQAKYVMEMTDKIEDTEELENFFGTDSIELVINGLVKQLDYIDIMRKHKFWEMKPYQNQHILNDVVKKHSVKFPIYKKGERPVAKLIE